MHILLAVILFLHGFAHLPGFLAYWKLAELKEMPYKTTILAGKIYVGDAGIHVFGALWLLASLAFVVASIGTGARLAWWQSVTMIASGFSFLLCLLGWPEARLGLFINLALIAFLLLNRQTGWLP